MPTACLLAISPRMHCAGGDLLLGGSAPGGLLLGGGGAVPEGGVFWEDLLLGGVCSRGVCSWGGGSAMPACTETDPPVDRTSFTMYRIMQPQL